MADSAGNWCLIESDPGVFTELIKEFGKQSSNGKYLSCLKTRVKGAQVEELWSLDDEQFNDLIQTLFEYDSKQASKDDDVFHFVSYVPIDGRLYELDGLKDGPIDLGPCSVGKQWVQAAKPIIQKRIKKYNEGEIHFNLMAIVTDRKTLYERQKANICDPEELERLQALIEEEIRKSKRYQIENIRRKHNYLPLIMELLKILAKEGKLVSLYQKAKEKTLEKESKKNKV
ncbi:Ubiquitin carboxyl-terminal hydrolase isozyme L5 [Trachymyrmex zeteki]|uniref:Ubiquitin carboxyl-terminal hydrolase calypso n=1 Tax=Mycetomoellerius zeteki TaxID=64791 RepID=A0A151WNE6_9HYME|nr:Ubiquitin carboxyl-terminal hydrolase isozyme L5 [Trachymyrmex zeteki]